MNNSLRESLSLRAGYDKEADSREGKTMVRKRKVGPTRSFSRETDELKARLKEAEETLEAIRSGAVDAIVVSGKTGERIYTLQGADQSYRLLVESISEGALTLNADGTILYGNLQFATMLGIPLDQIIGTSFLGCLFEDDRRVIERVFRRGDPGISRHQVALITREGEGLPVQFSLNIADIAGDRIFTAVVTDLAEQIRYREIVDEEKLLRSILEQEPVGIAVCDATGRIIRCSRALHEFCHEPPEKRFFEDLLDLRYEENGGWEKLLPAIPLQGVSLSVVDSILRCPDGKVRYLLTSAAPLLDGHGKTVGCLIVLRDVTERKAMEEHLAAQTVELRTSQAQLMDANKELESFSYSVSHDLRAPLRAIDGYARMIMRKQGDAFDDETRERFNLIRKNAGIMGKLIDDLLAFSRLGRKELQATAIDMRKMLESIWEELQDLHPHRRMILKIGDFPPGWGDPALIKQVLVNLLSNAVKFTRGREEAFIEAGTCIEDGMTAYYIRDNGVGFDMRYADKLFNVFQRLHDADEFEGTGVGLAIVLRIVKRHGGRVWADGEVDRGAGFYFSLPARGG